MAMKDYQVKRMFETIAFSYDFQNSFLSLRRDSYWRRVMAQCLELPADALVLDMATGTGEVAVEICNHHPEARIIGVDFSPKMLTIGRRKGKFKKFASRIHLSLGDGRQLPLKSGSFEAATIAFGIRNIEERDQALREFYRVLKPGGQLLIMEFDIPDDPLLGAGQFAIPDKLCLQLFSHFRTRVSDCKRIFAGNGQSWVHFSGGKETYLRGSQDFSRD